MTGDELKAVREAHAHIAIARNHWVKLDDNAAYEQLVAASRSLDRALRSNPPREIRRKAGRDRDRLAQEGAI